MNKTETRTAEWENRQEETLYSKIGGKETIESAVAKLSDKVLKDRELMPLFMNSEKGCLGEQQVNFLTAMFGGEGKIEGKRPIGQVHRKVCEKGLDEEKYEIFSRYLISSFREVGVKSQQLNEIKEILESLKSDILN